MIKLATSVLDSGFVGEAPAELMCLSSRLGVAEAATIEVLMQFEFPVLVKLVLVLAVVAVMRGPSQVCFQGHSVAQQVFEASAGEEWRPEDTAGLGLNGACFIAPSEAKLPHVFNSLLLVLGVAPKAAIVEEKIRAHPLLRVIESVVDRLHQVLGELTILMRLEMRQVRLVVFQVKIETVLSRLDGLVWPVEECIGLFKS